MNWEFSFLYFLQELHNPVLDVIMVVITTLGDAGILWIATAVAMVFSKKFRKCGVAVGVALLLMEITGNMGLKELIMRDRPCWIDPTVELLVKSPESFSFPSGHTFSSFASAVTIFLYHKRVGIAAIVMAALIAFSRMYIFVHFPTDILGGMVLGILVAFIARFLTNKVWSKVEEKRAAGK